MKWDKCYKRKGIVIFLISIILSIGFTDVAYAQRDAAYADFTEQLEMDELDAFLEEQEMPMEEGLSFSSVVERLLDGDGVFETETLVQWLSEQGFRLMRRNRTDFAQLLVLLLTFAMLQGIADICSDSLLSDITFLAVYFLLLYQSIRIFLTMQQLTESCMERMGEFTLLVQPVFCMAMIFSQGVHSAGLTYELLLLVLYLIQIILQKLVFPFVFVYLLTQFANYTWKEERFSGMAKLVESAILLVQKVLVTFVLGMNVIQGLVAPSVDQLKKTATVRTLGALPGIGGAMNAMSETLLGTGMLIKNCVGGAILVAMTVMCALPLLEIAVPVCLCKVLAAVTEPVVDKRVCGALQALARAGMLYIKLIITAVLMLFLTVAIVCVATGN